jgi:predicted RNA-binding Zn ribbon-like protein
MDAPKTALVVACPNNLRERADHIEECLFAHLQTAVLKPEVIEYALSEFERQLSASMGDVADNLQTLRDRANELKKEVRNLVTQLAACGHAPLVVEAINSRRRQLDEISSLLLSTDSGSISIQIGDIREFVTTNPTNDEGGYAKSQSGVAATRDRR